MKQTERFSSCPFPTLKLSAELSAAKQLPIILCVSRLQRYWEAAKQRAQFSTGHQHMGQANQMPRS